MANPVRDRVERSPWAHSPWMESVDHPEILLSFRNEHWPFDLEAEEGEESEPSREEFAPEQLPTMISERLEQAFQFRSLSDQLAALKAQLDLAIEAYRLAIAARGEEAGSTWPGYLFSLLTDGPFSRDQALRAITLWVTLRNAAGEVFSPHAAALEDGTFSMAWDKAHDHFEIELQPGGLFDWFYLDRLTDRMEGEQDLQVGYFSALMTDLLRKVAL
jgi:hypothetical protein